MASVRLIVLSSLAVVGIIMSLNYILTDISILTNQTVEDPTLQSIQMKAIELKSLMNSTIANNQSLVTNPAEQTSIPIITPILNLFERFVDALKFAWIFFKSIMISMDVFFTALTSPLLPFQEYLGLVYVSIAFLGLYYFVRWIRTSQ